MRHSPLRLAEERILVEQLRLLLGNVGSSVIPGFLVACMLVWTLSNDSDELKLSVWFAAAILPRLYCQMRLISHDALLATVAIFDEHQQ